MNKCDKAIKKELILIRLTLKHPIFEKDYTTQTE